MGDYDIALARLAVKYAPPRHRVLLLALLDELEVLRHKLGVEWPARLAELNAEQAEREARLARLEATVRALEVTP